MLDTAELRNIPMEGPFKDHNRNRSFLMRPGNVPSGGSFFGTLIKLVMVGGCCFMFLAVVGGGGFFAYKQMQKKQAEGGGDAGAPPAAPTA